MDIHKPKPWRGWPEFVKEIGTIVIGVLIALGGEQTVEWLHREHQVQEAREALRAEVADNMVAALRNRRRQVCDMTYLDRYAAWANGGPPPPSAAGAPYLALYSTNWDVMKSGPVAAMPTKEKLAFARFYALAADYNSMVERERSIALELGQQTALKRLDPQDAKSVLKAVTNFRGTEEVLIGMASAVPQLGKAVGAPARPIPPKTAADLDAFCRRAGVPAAS